jgi:hypothetical protein
MVDKYDQDAVSNSQKSKTQSFYDEDGEGSDGVEDVRIKGDDLIVSYSFLILCSLTPKVSKDHGCVSTAKTTASYLKTKNLRNYANTSTVWTMITPAQSVLTNLKTLLSLLDWSKTDSKFSRLYNW